METVSAKRADHLDIVKALGIISVVYGHAEGPLQVFVTLYHMALFFFVSGYFYKDSYTLSPLSLIKKRIRTLYVPFIVFGLFFGILHNFLYRINIYTDRLQSVYQHTQYLATNQEYVLNLLKILSFAKVEQILGPLWFLPVLFIVNVLFVLVMFAVHSANPARKDLWLATIVVAVFCAGFSYYPANNLFLRPVSIAMVVMIMFYFGYLFKRYEQAIEINFGIALSCFLILAACYTYGPIENGGHKFVSPPFYIGCSLAGIYLNLYIAKRLSPGTLLHRFLIYTGRNTITILALHYLAFRSVNYLQVVAYGLPAYMTGQHPFLNTSGAWWLLYFVAGVAFPLAGRVIYDRIKQLVSGKSVYPSPA